MLSSILYALTRLLLDLVQLLVSFNAIVSILRVGALWCLGRSEVQSARLTIYA